jgi:hypothetical protein
LKAREVGITFLIRREDLLVVKLQEGHEQTDKWREM